MNFFTQFLSDHIGSAGSLISFLLLTAGLWKLFPKCGVDSKWALVPVLRYYKLAQSVDREDAGFILALSILLGKCMITGASTFSELLSNNEKAGLAYIVLVLVVGIISVIYKIRVYVALCRMFDRKSRWVLGWVLSACICSLIWGLSDKFQSNISFDSKDTAAPVSDIEAEKIANGLTINLKKRTVRESLRKKTLLKDIHLNIRPGRMVMLLGGSGAGKTTLINAVIGYEKADAKISLNGRDVYDDYDRMLYEISLVPQQDLIRYDDTVVRTLNDAAVLRLPENVSRRDRVRRVNEVLDIFGLSSVRDSQVEKLSGGQRKRLSIAMEYISDPSLFVLDEPDSGLDGVLARDLMSRLHNIAKQGKMVIVITHSPDRVAEYFDDIIVLGKDADGTGRLVFFGTIEEARAFFEKEKIEDFVKSVNRPDEGGEGRADELIEKFAEVQNGRN